MHNIPATGKQLMAKKPQGLRRAEQNESLVRDIHIIAPERKEKKKHAILLCWYIACILKSNPQMRRA